MNDDRILEFMASVSEYMRNTDRRLEQMITVMHDGFGRVTDQLSQLNGRVDHLTERVDHLTERVDHLTERVDHLTARVDHLTDEVKELKNDVQEIKEEAAITNRRLSATFNQAGHLTEQSDVTALRISHVEQALQPTNAELHQRLLVLENKINLAS